MITLEELDRRLTALENVMAYETYTQRQIAQIVGVSESTIARYRKVGLISHIPGTHRYNFETILKLTNK